MSDVNLPNGWARLPLGEAGVWIGGGTPSKSNPRFWRDGTVPWVSPKDMKTRLIRRSEDRITIEAVEQSATRRVPAHSVLIVTRSGILEHSLPVALTAVEVTLNQDMKAIVPRAGIDAHYLSWALEGNEQAILDSCRKAGTTVASIETAVLQRFAIPVPPLAEQRRIVAALEEHLSELDAAVAGLERARANAIRLGQGAREHVLASYPLRSMRDLLAEPLANGRSVPTAERGFRVLRLTCLKGGAVDQDEYKIGAWTAADALPFLVRSGDFLIARGNGSRKLVGRGGLVGDVRAPVAFPDTLIRARFKKSVLNPEYLRLAWDTRVVREQIENAARTTAGIYKINQQDIERIDVPIPSTVQEQERVVLVLDERLATVNRCVAEIDTQLLRATRLRQSILKHAFEGKLVPQDPNDEPASVLLERVRAESQAAARPRMRVPKKSTPTPSRSHKR